MYSFGPLGSVDVIARNCKPLKTTPNVVAVRPAVHLTVSHVVTNVNLRSLFSPPALRRSSALGQNESANRRRMLQSDKGSRGERGRHFASFLVETRKRFQPLVAH